MNQINTKLLKSSLTLEDHKSICKALGIPAFSENSKQIVYFTGDKHVNPYNGSPKLIFYKDTSIYMGFSAGMSYDIISSPNAVSLYSNNPLPSSTLLTLSSPSQAKKLIVFNVLPRPMYMIGKLILKSLSVSGEQAQP